MPLQRCRTASYPQWSQRSTCSDSAASSLPSSPPTGQTVHSLGLQDSQVQLQLLPFGLCTSGCAIVHNMCSRMCRRTSTESNTGAPSFLLKGRCLRIEPRGVQQREALDYRGFGYPPQSHWHPRPEPWRLRPAPGSATPRGPLPGVKYPFNVQSACTMPRKHSQIPHTAGSRVGCLPGTAPAGATRHQTN